MKRKRPNLLFVFADQMRAMDMGCAGHPIVQTPAMDRMAREGMRCTHHYATVPVCGPNRACLLTGTYPKVNRVAANDLPLPTGMPTFGTIAKEHGYRTGYIGKWHLDGLPRSKFTPPGERRFGFDFWAAYNCTHSYMKPRWYRDTDQLIEPEGFEPELQTNLAIEFLSEQCVDDPPFCLMLSWGPPHNPYRQMPQQYLDMYDPATLPLRPNVVETPTSGEWALKEGDCRENTAGYLGHITALDDQLARLMHALDELNLAEDTILVFTSDHGDMLYSHGVIRKQWPHEESVGVPLLLHWPGRLAGGRDSDLLIGTVDLLPTLGAMMGWRMPDGVQGLDLSQHLLHPGAAGPGPQSVFLLNPYSCDEAMLQGMPEWRGVRTRRYTYAQCATEVGPKPWLLFDNEIDPYQQDNQADKLITAEAQDQCQALLDTWLQQTDDAVVFGDAYMQREDLTEDWHERQVAMGRA